MNTITVAIILLVTLITPGRVHVSKSNIDEFFKNEKKKLESKNVACKLHKITKKGLDNLRLQSTNDVLGTIACTIPYLEENQQDGFFWTVLGSFYSDIKSISQANTCFKTASKITGKISGSIKEWHFIGPFVIGKAEVDGDPLEAFGGIRNVFPYHLLKTNTFYSELVPGGEIKWSTIKVGVNDMTNVSPKVNWNDLVSSLGSLGITEWQGWVVGEFAVNEKDQNIVFQCLGIHTVYIDDVPVTGDVYYREKFWFAVKLMQGVHRIYIRLRTTVSVNFKCSLKITTALFSILQPSFLPDLVDGILFSSYISIPIMNFQHSKSIRVTRVSVKEGINFKSELVGRSFAVAPGQVFLLPIKIYQEPPHSSSNCDSVAIKLKISTSEGPHTTTLSLRCRKRSESFLYTFLDHDGSIQHAAAIQPIGGCHAKACPVLLTLHGTTVQPQNQADSYKHMVDGEFVFGLENTWVLAPTRHGAHNWEGPGALTALCALDTLAELTSREPWGSVMADKGKLIYAGHSMGGHGAWHLATHFPDKGLALIALAGWIRKEEYGDSNLFFRHDIARSHVEPATKAVMEACIAENDVDRHISNLKDIPVLARIGGDDRTVHPFYVRRMYRLLKEEGISVNYTELSGKEHWWWDTWETNDGGVLNDKLLRDFTLHHSGASQQSCDKDDESCDTSESDKYLVESNIPRELTVTCYNPAFMDSVFGLKILQQIIPFRKSEIKVHIADNVTLTTSNVARFTFTDAPNRKIHWENARVKIDGSYHLMKEDMQQMLDGSSTHLCKQQGVWSVCADDIYSIEERGPLNLGPARRIAESKFIIVVGSHGETSVVEILQSFGVYLANLFLLTSDTVAPIVRDTDLENYAHEDMNLIIIGGRNHNALAEKFLKTIPVDIGEQVVLQNCRFSSPRTGVLTLAPHGSRHLALLLMANSVEGLQDVISLATPTIPPMTRSPFSNLIPDYIITGPEYQLKGPGGYLCAGFWGNKWEYRPELSSCVC